MTSTRSMLATDCEPKPAGCAKPLRKFAETLPKPRARKLSFSVVLRTDAS